MSCENEVATEGEDRGAQALGEHAQEKVAAAERRANEATVAMKPAFRHSLVGGTLAHSTAGFETMEWKHALAAYTDAGADTRGGDLSLASNMLTSQALTLDAVFTEMLSRATKNIGQYPEAMERYMRLALKAQAQSRASIEVLVKMHQPREQTVKHVHIDNRGGQAVVAESVHSGGSKIEYDGQSYGPDQPGAISPALLGEDPAWHGLPVPGDARPEAVPAPRREGRRADR